MVDRIKEAPQAKFIFLNFKSRRKQSVLTFFIYGYRANIYNVAPSPNYEEKIGKFQARIR